MWNRTRSIAATIALSAAVLGTGTHAFADKGDKNDRNDRNERNDRNDRNDDNRPRKAALERRNAEAEVQKEMAKALTAILDENGPDNLVGVITASDRDHVEEGLKRNNADYKKRVRDYLETWRDKYGHKFDPEANAEYLTAAKLDYFDWQDKHYVSATIPATKYEKEAELRFVEAGGEGHYRLQLANDLGGEELAQRISGAINRTATVKSQWPKDEKEAYNTETRNILAALDYDSNHERKRSSRDKD